MDISSLNKGLQKLIDKKDIFLVVVTLLIFFVGAAVLFGDYSSKMQDLKDQALKRSQKIEHIAKHNKAQKEFDAFKAGLPNPRSVDALVNEIAGYAAQQGIEITNVNSNDPKFLDFYSVTAISLSIKVKNFKNLVAFFQKIEESASHFKIQMWSGKLLGNNAEGSLQCEVGINVTQLKP